MEDTKNIIKKAIECHKALDYTNAEILYLDFLDKNPKEAKAYHLLGAMYMQSKDYNKANKTLLKAFELENSIPVETDLALSFYELKNYTDALFHLKNVLKTEKSKFLIDKAVECAQITGSLRDFLDYSILSLEFYGDDLFKLRDIASAAQDLNEFETAKFFLEKIIKICPNDNVACNNLGLVYEFLSDFENAENLYKKAIKINPTPEAAYNLSILLKRERKYTESLDMLEYAKKLGYKEEKYNYAYSLLRLTQKDFEAYKQYSEYLRLKQKDILTIWWDGKIKDKNAIFVICATDGFGDVLMFARYLDFINPNDYKEVILIVPENMYELFKFNFPGFKIVKMGQTLCYTFGSTLIDLPFVLKLDFDHIPSGDKYLIAPPEYSKKWEDKFNDIPSKATKTDEEARKKLKIGLFFSGNTKDKRTLYNRNITLKHLESLINIEGTEFYSLQPENTFKEDLERLGIIDLSDKITDFSDTAAIIENLDLVISIDSSVLHLSGSLGKKTFMLLPYSGDWRWFSDTKNTPWYNSVEIFRQETEGNWNPVIERVRARLIEMVQQTEKG